MTLKTHTRALGLLAAAFALSVPDAQAQTSANAPAPVSKANWPADVDRQSGFRLPVPKREDLDESGREAFDRGTTPGATTAGLQGPTGIQLYSTKTAPLHSALNAYLRREAGISPRIREIAIMTTAREFDSLFEWNAHEPEGLKEGVPPAVVDAIKNRKALDGLDPTDAIVIQFGRELWRDHKVTSPTFAKAKDVFGPKQLVDLVMLMGNYASTAALLTAFDMQIHEGETPMLPVR
jgi:4-carboxymuconolactone decarboxylase